MSGKTISTENKDTILKVEEKKITYKGKSIKITDFSTEILKSRRA
jgi:hypothetical protein